MVPTLLPFLDAKSVSVAQQMGPGSATLGTELAVLGGVLLVILVVLLLLRRAPRRDVPQPVDEDWILIDGSNVMHWQDNTPRLDTIRKVVDRVRELGYVPGVVFDANAGFKLEGRYLHDQDFARLLGIEPRQVLVVPKGSQADPFLLQTARDFGTRIVSNDRFRDWADAHPEVHDAGLLIRGRASDGGVMLRGLDPRPTKPG